MATVNFKCSTLMKRSNTLGNQPVSFKENSSHSNSLSKMGESIGQFASATLNHRQSKSKLCFPGRDSSHGDSSIEFHEKYNDIAKPFNQSEDDTKANRLKFNTNELSISSIYEEKKRSKLNRKITKKQPSKNPINKSEFKSFKKYTYKALNQPEEITHNLNILGDISDIDDTLNNNQNEKEINVQSIIIEPVPPKENEEESDIDCNVISDDENIDEDISSKITHYQTPTIPKGQFNTGGINYKNLLTHYYNDDIACVPDEKINEMEKNLMEIDSYRKSIEESKELIQKLRNQLDSQTTANPMNQSSLPYPGKLPDEDYLLCELTELKHRYNTKTEKFKLIVQKLKSAIIQSTSASPSNDKL